MPLIAGLGNPGKKYSGSRHNIGFEVIDELAVSLSAKLSAGRGAFYTGKARLGDHQLRLVKPSTYMNHSGDAIQQALQWFKIPPGECLICYDDLNLNVGDIRVRRGGSAGGHNGMKDIIRKLGTDQFPRLRIGIGNDFRGGQQINYVLSPFSAEQREAIDSAVKKAADAILTFTREGIDAAMNEYN